MTDYEMNWQAESAKEELELLKAKIKEFDRFLNDPVMLSFFIINQVIKGKFDELFNVQ